MTENTIAARLAGRTDLSDDDILEIFLDWTVDEGFDLYPAQEEAVLEIMAGRHLILNTPTGSGKSLVALAMHSRALARGEKSFYTSPIKALVSEKFFELCKVLGPDNVGMMTGDATINRNASIICCTAEILSNMCLRQGRSTPADYVVMDEFHYYADRDRGVAWQIPLLTLDKATFLLMSATLGDVTEISNLLEEKTGQSVAVVRSTERPVPLEFDYGLYPLHEQVDTLVKEEKAPIYLVCFTQKSAAEQAQNLMSVNFCSKDEKREIADLLKGVAFDSPYGKTVQRTLRHGVGLHHAGLLPKYRLLVEKLSQKGLLKVICGTDTLGVGVNIPIRTVLFTKLCKFDGEKVGVLTVRDFKQISGRAGRKGFDDKGWVLAQAPEHVIENRRRSDKPGKKVTKKQPPKRGYVHWDKSTFERLVQNEPEPLESRFSISHGMLLNLLQREDNEYLVGGGYRRLIELIAASHQREPEKKRDRRTAARLFKSLVEANVIEVSEPGREGRWVKISEGFQEHFSLHHSLSLFLLELLDLLDPEDPDYALDVVSMVESILENPRVILWRQEDLLKDELIARLKAEGVEYEERMNQLEQVTYPKPHETLIYEVFNRFSAHHPWVVGESIRPKSILRDMVERFANFDEYVREYGLQRSEGVLLRYLSQAYKTLVQTVPERNYTEGVVEVIGYMRTVLARVDSSLVREWEALQDVAPEERQQRGVDDFDVSKDVRVFYARIRAEMATLLRSLARRRYEDAALSVRRTDELAHDAGWFEDALAPYFAEYDKLIADHRARTTDKTQIISTGPHEWAVTQIIVDPEEDNMWFIEGEIDLRQNTNPDGPLVAVTRIGC